MADTKKRWSYNAGQKGRNWVRAYEEAKSGDLYLEWFEDTDDGRKRRRRKLPHRDREKAATTADEVAAAFGRHQPHEALRRRTDPTLGELFDKYLAEETPHKGRGKQAHDRRAAKMFEASFGRGRKAMTLNLGDWQRFIRARRDGTARPVGKPVSSRERKRQGRGDSVVGDRQIEYDLKFLWAVLNWAATTGNEEGDLLIPRNPLKQYVRTRHWPKEQNPNRPVLTGDQYRGMLDVAEGIDWRFRLALVLAHETGHRIKSIRRLRWSDVDLEEGWLWWRRENDKVDWEHRTPLSGEATEALRRARTEHPAIGDTRVFPSPEDPSRPCSRHLVRNWWSAAQVTLEQRGLLTSVKGLGWHSLRRKFANDFRELPLKDLAVLGGWKDTRTIVQCYQQGSEERMREAIANRPRRAAGGGSIDSSN